MRKVLLFLVIQLALLGSVASATFEVDEDLMRSIEDTLKSLDSNIAMKDAKAAAAEARELSDLFAQIETYYAGRGDGGEGVTHSHKSRELASQILQGVEAKDFDAAADVVNNFARTCKACHQVYRKE